MALKLKIDYCGIVADYWKIINMRSDYRTNTLILDLALYANQEAREKNIKNVLLVRQFVFSSPDMDREEQYKQIKEPILDDKKKNINEFANAEDC